MIALQHQTDKKTMHTDSANSSIALRYKIALATIYMLLVCIWSLTITFHGAPDESTHFYLLDYMYTMRDFPNGIDILQPFTGKVTQYTWTHGEFWYHGLPFPHVVGGLITAAISSVFLPDNLMYIGARSFNWILAGFFIIALFRIARAHGLQHQTSALIALTIALIPQVTFIFSYFNSDAYGITIIALSLAALLEYNQAATSRRAISLGACIGLLLLAKLYFLPSLVFICVVLILRHFYIKPRKTRSLIISIVTALFVSAPMLIYTYSAFGEITGISGQVAFVEMHKNNPGSIAGTCYLWCTESLINFNELTPWLRKSAMSYFSVTGWMGIYIQPWQYTVALSAACLSIALAIYSTVDSYRKLEKKSFYLEHVLPLIMILGLMPSIVILSIVGSQLAMPQPQGRYLFVTIPFWAYLLALTGKAFTTKPKQLGQEHF